MEAWDQWIGRRERPDREARCLECNDVFHPDRRNQRFCSGACRARWWETAYPRRQREVVLRAERSAP